MSIWNLIGQIPGAVGGIVNARVVQRIAIKLSVRLSALLSTVKYGISFSQGPTSLTIKNRKGLKFSVRVKEAYVQITQRTGISLQNVLSKSPDIVVPGFIISELEYSLTSEKPSNNANQFPEGGRTDWTNIANAEGAADGSVASFAANALGVRGGQLRLIFQNYLSKTELTITDVRVNLFISVAGTTLNNANVRVLLILPSVGNYTLATITGDISGSRSWDVTSIIGGDWGKLDEAQIAVTASSAVGQLWTSTVDAVTLEVEATRLETV